jgi:LysM repeat protein
MKWILLLALVVSPVTRLSAQDAATEERLNQLNGKLQDILSAQEDLRKRMSELAREVQSLREEQSKPSPAAASHEDLSRVAKAVEEVDRKRLEDYDKIRAELLKLMKTVTLPPSSKKTTSESKTEKSATPEKGYEYVVQKGDTLSVIVQAYREKNIKVTTEQILKANPGLKPERMQPGQKIFIPAPPP